MEGTDKNHPQMAGVYRIGLWHWVSCLNPVFLVCDRHQKTCHGPRTQDVEPKKSKLPRHLAILKELNLGPWTFQRTMNLHHQ